MKRWMHRLGALALLLFCNLWLSGCVSDLVRGGVEAGKGGIELVGAGLKETTYVTGLSSRPEAYDGHSPDYSNQDFLSGFSIKPDAKPWIGRTFSMIRSFKGMKPQEALPETQQLAVLGRLDVDQDSLITEAEAKNGFEKIRNDLGKQTPIDVTPIDARP